MYFLIFLFSLFILFLLFIYNNVSSKEPYINVNIDPNHILQEYPNLLNENECNEIIQLAKNKGLSKSKVVENNQLNKENHEFRNSSQCWISASSHPSLLKLAKISQDVTGLPLENQEEVQIVRYTEGGKFDAHFDPCISQDINICNNMNRNAGQRRSTLLVYLNDVSEGGETEFVNLNYKIKPQVGKGMLFWSTDNQDNLLQNSKHRGNPVIQGEKWIATIWSHPLPFT